MYEKLGFSESKHLVETMRKYYDEYIRYGVNDLNSFRAKLEELFPTKEGDFSFSEEEQYYEQNKYTPEYNNLREDKVFSEDLFDSLDKPAPKKTGGFLALINKLRRKEQEKERPKPELEDEER